MNLYNLVFRDLEELLNEDAAIKFALSCLIENERFTELEELLREQSCLGGVEGEPGWLIERRNLHDQNGYEHWPQEAQYYIYVDPEAFSLQFPEIYLTRCEFKNYVKKILNLKNNSKP